MSDRASETQAKLLQDLLDNTRRVVEERYIENGKIAHPDRYEGRTAGAALAMQMERYHAGRAGREHYRASQPKPTEENVKTYNVYEVVFVMAPTKTQEEEGIGAKIVSGDTPLLLVATSENAAVAAAGKMLGLEVNLNSSLIHAVTRVFG